MVLYGGRCRCEWFVAVIYRSTKLLAWISYGVLLVHRTTFIHFEAIGKARSIVPVSFNVVPAGSLVFLHPVIKNKLSVEG